MHDFPAQALLAVVLVLGGGLLVVPVVRREVAAAVARGEALPRVFAWYEGVARRASWLGVSGGALVVVGWFVAPAAHGVGGGLGVAGVAVAAYALLAVVVTRAGRAAARGVGEAQASSVRRAPGRR